MPPLKNPKETNFIQLAPRKSQVAAETDVLVVGGGPAGLGAAVGAAQAGADVILVERYGFLGGNATAALVMPLMSFYTQKHENEKEGAVTFLPTDHGEGESVIAGVLSKFLKKLIESGGAIGPSLETGFVVPFDPELFKLSALDLLDESGVKYLFHSFASGIIGNDYPEGVVLETKSGPLVIKSKTIIDCTGDGDIAYYSGAEYEIGREDGLVQPMTLMFRIAEFNKANFEMYVKEHPDQWKGVHGLWDLVNKASANGELQLPREDVLFFATPHQNELAINCTRITKVLGINVWDLTYAESESRRQMQQIFSFLKKYVPGFNDAYIIQSGVNIGVRETRRIIGEYKLTAQDVLQAKKFDDTIARSSYPIDVHNPSGKGTDLRRIPPGEYYQIPLRCLIPKNIKNLLVAGRCISGTHEAHSSYRVMPVSMATGHAAGVCAALASLNSKAPKDVDIKDVQNELVYQGALL